MRTTGAGFSARSLTDWPRFGGAGWQRFQVRGQPLKTFGLAPVRPHHRPSFRRHLADFAHRINPRAVNKRVLESLIAAGAFDVIEKNRARTLAAADAMAAMGQTSIAKYLAETADGWNEQIDDWAYARDTEIARRLGIDGYYMRIGFSSGDANARSHGLIPIRNRPDGNEASCAGCCRRSPPGLPIPGPSTVWR